MFATDAGLGLADTITGFDAGGDGVLAEDLLSFATTIAGAATYIGYFTNATLANTALAAGSGALQIALVDEIDGTYLYADANDDGVINTGDMAIKMVGLTGTLDQSDFVTLV
jgi:hypothetical protein